VTGKLEFITNVLDACTPMPWVKEKIGFLLSEQGQLRIMAAHKTGKLWVVYGMKIDAPWGEWFVGERVDTVRRGKVIWPAELAADRDRFDAIPYGEPTAKQMLEFLHSEDGKEQIKLTRPKGKWWLSRDTVVNAPWDGEWRAGNWISHMRSSRGSWPDEFADVRDRFDAIPYGESTVKQKLDFLYSEDGQKQILSTAPVGQLRFCKATRLDAPWDAEWKAGSWIYLIKAERVEKTPEIKAEWDRIEGLQLRLGEPTVKVKIDFLYTEDAINQVKSLRGENASARGAPSSATTAETLVAFLPRSVGFRRDTISAVHVVQCIAGMADVADQGSRYRPAQTRLPRLNVWTTVVWPLPRDRQGPRATGSESCGPEVWMHRLAVDRA